MIDRQRNIIPQVPYNAYNTIVSMNLNLFLYISRLIVVFFSTSLIYSTDYYNFEFILTDELLTKKNYALNAIKSYCSSM